MRKKLTFVVTLEPPTGATAADCRRHIQEAVDTWAGQYHESHPMRWLRAESVHVKRAGLGVTCPACGRLSNG